MKIKIQILQDGLTPPKNTIIVNKIPREAVAPRGAEYRQLYSILNALNLHVKIIIVPKNPIPQAAKTRQVTMIGEVILS